eukprot:UN03132
MPDAYNPLVSNSYDFFLRGEEITSGAQRIHNTKVLVAQANKHKIPLHTIQSYIIHLNMQLLHMVDVVLV